MGDNPSEDFVLRSDGRQVTLHELMNGFRFTIDSDVDFRFGGNLFEDSDDELESECDSDENPDFEENHLEELAREQAEQSGEGGPQVSTAPWKTLLVYGPRSLEELRQKMDINVTDDGRVKKRILQSIPGCKAVPPDGKVTIDYCGFVNGANTPFDSTLTAGRPSSFRLEPPGELIMGLRLGLKTMCHLETAQFLIPYDYAFGELGCPTRVPPKADIVFNVRMHKFVTPARLGEYENLTFDEIEALPFEQFIKGAKELYAQGEALVLEEATKKAMKFFHEIVHVLESRETINEEEHDQRANLQAAAHWRLAEGYIKLDKPAQACSQSKKSLNFNCNEYRARALFTFATAKIEFGTIDDYMIASDFLKTCRFCGGYGPRFDALKEKINARLAEEKEKEEENKENEPQEEENQPQETQDEETTT